MERSKVEERTRKEQKEEEKKELLRKTTKINEEILSLEEEKNKLKKECKEKLEEIDTNKLKYKNKKEAVKKDIKEEYKEKINKIEETLLEKKKEKADIKNLKKEEVKKLELIEIEENDNETEHEMVNVEIKKYVEIKCNYISQGNKPIKKIVHMADIHIRLSLLHKEYGIVFERLYRELLEIKEECLIVICGDLLHKKNELDPDTIMFVWNFIKKLSQIHPLVIIAGNHDCYEYTDKLDSITAILEDRAFKNIYYLKESGVYIYNNIIFGVSAIRDKYILSKEEMDSIIEKNKTEIDYPKEEIKKIALYHGQIIGATTLNPHYIPNVTKSKSLNMFGNYDYILLGDIHKHQYLNINKTAAYPGSLISQSYGETDESHGYIEWNIMTGESKYKIIENEYGYMELDIEEIIENKEQVILSKELIERKLEKKRNGKVKLLIDGEYLKKVTAIRIVNQIKEVYENIIIKPIYTMNSTDLTNIKTKIESVIIEKQSDLKIDTLIRQYLLKKYDLDEDGLNKLMSEIYNIQKEHIIEKNNIEYEKGDWKLLLLSFDNMYIYGKGNTIDFTENYMSNIVGIFGNNAIGKSALIDIITYILFGRSARDEESLNPKDLINKQCNDARGIIIFESNGNKYLINRICSRENVHKDKHRASLHTLEEIDENEDIKKINIYTLNGKKYKTTVISTEKTHTDNEIIRIIGTYENFLNSSILLQGNNKTFKLKKDDERKKLLCEILNIDMFSSIHQIISTKYNKLNYEWEKTLKDLAKICNIIIPSSTVKDKYLIALNDIQCTLADFKENKNIYYNTIKEIEAHINEKKDEFEIIQKENDMLMLNLKSIDKRFINYTEDQIKDESKIILENKEKLLNKNKELYKMLDIKYDKELIDEYKIQFDENKKTKELLGQKIHNLLLDRKNIGNFDIDLYEEQKNNIKTEINKLKKDIKGYKKYNSKAIDENKEEIMDKIKEIEKDKIIHTHELQEENFDYDNTKKELKKIKKVLQELKNELIDLENSELYQQKTMIIDSYNQLINNNRSILDLTILETKNMFEDDNIDKIKLKEKFNIIVDTIYLLLNNTDNNNHIIVKKYNLLKDLEEKYKNKLNHKIDVENEMKILQTNIETHQKNIDINNLIQNYNEELTDLYEDLENIKIYSDKLSQLNKLNCEQNNIEENYNRYNFNSDIDLEIKKIQLQINEIDLFVEKYMTMYEKYNCYIKYTSEIETNLNKIKNYDDLMSVITESIDNIISNQTIKNKIELNKNNIINIQETITDLQQKLYMTHRDHNIVENKIINIQNGLDEIEKIQESHAIYKVLSEATSENGLQIFLLEQSLTFINDKLNYILKDSIGKTIKLIMDKNKKINMIVETPFGIIDSISGMESFMIDLAFKIVLTQISEMPRSNVLFIDESISVLDHDRLTNIDSLFEFITQYYNFVFLITHLQSIKNSLNCYLFIKNKNNKSFINNTDTLNKYIFIDNDNTKNNDNDEDQIITKKNKKKIINNSI